MESVENESQQYISKGLNELAVWTLNSHEESISAEEFEAAVHDVKELMNLYRCAIMEVETKFNVLDASFSLRHEQNPIAGISSRLKSYDSIYEKVHRANIAPGLDSLRANMHDIAGVRIVCSFEEDVYLLAECFERQDDVKILRRKDYIALPKDNGYRSLHLICEVPVFLPEQTEYMQVEVQLRTIAMEFWANLEHKMRYKKDVAPEVQKAISKELLQCAEMSSRLDKRMQSVRRAINGFGFLDDLSDYA